MHTEIDTSSSATLTGHGIASALVEAMLPAGVNLPAADAEAICAQVADWLAEQPLLRASLTSTLLWLEGRSVLATGQRFSKASLSRRQQILNHLARTRLSSQLLRALSLPFKAAWLLDDDTQQRLGSRPRVQVPSQVETFRWQAQITSAADLDGDETLEADVVVIGTGAGGAAAAYELASRGLAVVLLEEGQYYDRRHFSGQLTEVIPRLYRALGATTAMGNALIPVPVGRSVGGTTTINSGTCMRTPAPILQRWREERGLADFTDAALAPWFQDVEEMLGVAPAEPRYVGEIGEVMRTGGAALGFQRMHTLQRNAPGCDGQGLCQFGCPTDAKRSTNVSYVPRALERGAFLFTGLRAEKLLHHQQRIHGVVATGCNAEGKPVRVTVQAPHVIVAAGTLMTPRLLERNGVRNPHLGKHLTLHPCGVVNGVFPERNFGNSRTIPQGFGIADLAGEGLMFEGGTPPLAGHGLFCNAYGKEFVRLCEQYQQTAYFGFMLRDTSEGEVRRGPHRDLPRIRYHMNEHDFSLFKKGIETLARMFFAAGATEVIIPGPARHRSLKREKDLTALLSAPLKPRDFLMSAYHPLGTARIAVRADEGVCDSDHQVFGWQGLYVMDGSSVPTSLGANPQVTIMAMAARAASRLADHIQH